MSDAAEDYASMRARVTELVRSLTADQAESPVPGCPGWTVRDLLSHLTGLCADVVAGRLEGAGTPAWTARQVEERQGRSVDALLAEWDVVGPEAAAALPSLGGVGRRFVFDITVHDDDLREALGLPLGEGAPHGVVLDGLVKRLGGQIIGLPPLRLHAGNRAWVLCDAEPATELRVGTPGELSRVLSGRRTEEQLRAMDWSGNPEPFLPHLSGFRPGE